MRTSFLALAACIACAEQDPETMGDFGADAERAGPVAPDEPRANIVYVMTNDPGENRIIGLRHGRDGVERFGSWGTAGAGLGTVELPLLLPDDGIDPLVSEGSLQRVGNHLLAVNAGDGTVSAFRVGDRGRLSLADVAPVGGYPNSITSRGDHVFVAVSPGPDAEGGIAHLVVSGEGGLEHRGLLPLSVPEAHPARVLATRDHLVATELMQGLIDVWTFDGDEVRVPTRFASAGPGPFGIASLGGQIVVSEAAPEMPGMASVSTYAITDGGAEVISAAVGNGQSATCWEAVTPDGRFVFTSNTESGTISSYAASQDGAVRLHEAVAATPDGAPIDMDISSDGRYLYVLLGGTGAVAVYGIRDNGSLARVELASDVGLPELGSQGLVAW
jgi:6-phosphogluconolactonase